MEELINELVQQYVNDEITWHDIQDDVEVYVLKQDGKGCTHDTNIIIDRFFKETEILSEIQKRINKEVI